MKRKLLFAAALVAGALGLEAQAQTWTASDLADGKYVFQNVGSGRFLGPGNSWGTQASLLAQSHYNTLAKVSDGVYTIESQVSNGGTNHYFAGGFMDGAATNVTIADNGDGIFTMSNGTNYYGYDGSTMVLASNLTDPTNENAQWKIIAYDDYLASATLNNPVDATYRILDQNFDRNNRNGGGSNNDLGNKWTMEASNKNLCGGKDDNKCAESWRAAFTLSQTVTLPNGYYKVRAQAALTEYTVTGNDFPVVYAGDKTTPFLLMQNGESSMDAMSEQFTAGNYFTEWSDMVTVTTKSLTLGVKGTRTDTWCIWDNIQLMYYGPLDLSALKTSLADAIAEGQALDGKKFNTTTVNDLNDVLGTYSGASYDNSDDYEAAIAAVTAAVNAANASIANYETAKSYLDLSATLDEAGKANYAANATVKEVQEAYNDGTLVAVSAEQIAAMMEAIRTAAKVQTTAGADMTLAIVNPTVDGSDGWTIERPVGGNGPLINGTAFEYWAGNASSRENASFDYYQVINGLPAGKYTVSAEMYNSLNSEGGAVFNASSGVYGNDKSALVDVDGTTLTKYTTPEIVVTDGTLRLGVKSVEKMGARWFVADNFTLTFVEAIALQDYYDQIDALVATAEAISSEQSAATATNLAAAVAAGKAASGKETNIDTLNEVIANLNAAIESSNASVAAFALGAKLNVIAKDAFYMTNLNAGLDASGNSNLSAMTYTAATANTWHTNTWSTEGNSDGSGMTTPFYELWVGGGALLNDATISSQKIENLAAGHYRLSALVRAINEKGLSGAEISGVNFYANNEVVDLATLPHYTYNALEGNAGTVSVELDIEEGGSLEFGFTIASTNMSWIAFKDVTLEYMPLTEANYYVGEAGWATCIVPNELELGSDSKAYTVAGVENNVLVLEEVDAIPANTPVVISGEGSNAAVVYSSAKADTTYTAGLLTGVYAETAAPVGSYVLQNQSGKVGFYKVEATQPKVGAGHAYMTYEAPAQAEEAAKAFYFAADDATAIEAVSAIAAGQVEAIYTVNGAKVNGLQKGLNIVKMQDGTVQKVLVK